MESGRVAVPVSAVPKLQMQFLCLLQRRGYNRACSGAEGSVIELLVQGFGCIHNLYKIFMHQRVLFIKYLQVLL